MVDVGYPQMSGCLRPYKGECYHLPDFQRGSSPKGKKEIFNHRHSSLRCTIERTFAVLKNRWRMLREMHSFPLEKQVKIVIASIALHNFIRINARTNMDLNHMMMIKGYFHSMKKKVEWIHLLRKMVQSYKREGRRT